MREWRQVRITKLIYLFLFLFIFCALKPVDLDTWYKWSEVYFTILQVTVMQAETISAVARPRIETLIVLNSHS